MADFYKDRFNIFTGSIIQSVGFISEQYVFQRSPVPEIIQRLAFNRGILENLLRIFFIFEDTPQIWNGLAINTYSFRGTLGGQYFNYEDKTVKEVFNFMLDLYKELYGDFETEEERQNFSNVFLTAFMNQLTGSTRRVVDLYNNFVTRNTDTALDKIWIISKPDRTVGARARFNQLITRDKELIDNTNEEFPFERIPIEAIYHLRNGINNASREEANREAELYHQLLEDREFERQTAQNTVQEYNRMTRARNRNITRNLYNLQRLIPTQRLNVDNNLDARQNDIRYSVRSRYLL